MFDNPAIDVSIGLVFIFLLYSLLATIVQEFIANMFSFRAKVLEKGILRMLEDGKTTTSYPIWDRVKSFFGMFFRFNNLKGKAAATTFYAHPLIKYLAEDNWYSKPAYINAKDFAKVLMDMLRGINGATINNAVEEVDKTLQSGVLKTDILDIASVDKNHPATKAKQSLEGKIATINAETLLYLKSLWVEADYDVDVFQAKLENWFDTTMDRVSGWYKRYTQTILFLIGMLLAVGFNVDTVGIAKKLMKDPKLREQMVQSATAYMQKNQDLGTQLQRMEQQGQQNTPAYASTQAAFDSISKQSDTLLMQAKQMTDNDIKDVNEVMGLGYDCNHYKLMHIFFFCYPDVSFLNFIGWIITALAVSLGAPFWFDLLNKLVKLRGSAKAGSSNAASVNNDTVPQAAPISVNVNTQSTGEEAVG